jgi:hypothetical protein
MLRILENLSFYKVLRIFKGNNSHLNVNFKTLLLDNKKTGQSARESVLPSVVTSLGPKAVKKGASPGIPPGTCQ